jgi:FkbM family methyltransferase
MPAESQLEPLPQPVAHAPARQLWRAVLYRVHTFLLRREVLTVDLPWLGLRMRVGAEDMLGRRLYRTAVYESDVTSFVLRWLAKTPPAVVLDVGANVGFYSLLVGRVWGKRAEVHAFEAEPWNFDLLRQNLQDNGMLAAGAGPGVTPHFGAIADRDGECTLHLWKRSNRGKHSLVPFAAGTGPGTSLQVPARTLDRCWAEAGLGDREVALMKIDIEGAEHQAFLGARTVLPRCRVVLAELSPKFLARAGISLDEHLGLLRDHGFVPFVVGAGGHLSPLDLDQVRQSGKTCNIAHVRADQVAAVTR